jgi:hypothetical protein
MRSIVKKQKWRKRFWKEDLYSKYFDLNNIVYIHIPKCTGTSICHHLYGEDYWHRCCYLTQSSKGK